MYDIVCHHHMYACDIVCHRYMYKCFDLIVRSGMLMILDERSDMCINVVEC